MFGKCDSGIELIEENIGKLLNSGTYLFMGERETGKSSFVLQFILQGLKEGKTCLVVTAGLPRDFVIYAESLGMDVSQHISEGHLIIYEYAAGGEFSAKEFLEEVTAVIKKNDVSRFALDPLISRNISEEEILPFSELLPAFWGNIEKRQIVSFVTLELPLSAELFVMKKKLEVSSVGVFFLKSVSETEKILSVRKLTGQSALSNKEFRFTIEKNAGIQEVKESNSLGFHRYFSKDKPAGSTAGSTPGSITFQKEEKGEKKKKITFRI